MKIPVALAVEFGLLSTTTSREMAVAYSGKDKQRGTVLEITAGRVDVGADIGFLSQYPDEKEFLMQPLACLEVRKTPLYILHLPQVAQSLPSYDFQLILIIMLTNQNMQALIVD
jgi:hypothetical protein